MLPHVTSEEASVLLTINVSPPPEASNPDVTERLPQLSSHSKPAVTRAVMTQEPGDLTQPPLE